MSSEKPDSKAHLTPEERAFFSLVSGAALANPFSDERIDFDLKISGLFPGVTYEDRLNRTIMEVRNRIGQFETEGRANIHCFTGGDRRLMEHTLLFDVFHRFLEPFDQFIRDQMSAGPRSLKVPFASRALALLRKRGFDSESAARFFSLFFQLRRAFFFIETHLVGRSLSMKALRKKLWNNVFTRNLEIYNQYLWNRMEDFSTVLLGETGTGKGTAAAAIGRSGYIPFDENTGRFVETFPHAFVALNLSRFPESLIESELFGHKKGAFTGAVEDFRGVFDRCSPFGAIFLDEIGEVSEPVQIKLLQVIQERWFTPVGSHEKHRFQGRVIAATNRTMGELRGSGGLRDDFYYRLCSDVIVVPPLRRRIQEDDGELDDLLAHTLERILGAPSPELVENVKKAILVSPGKDYGWPGNVRELEQRVRRILLDPDSAGDRIFRNTDMLALLQSGIEGGSLSARDLLSGYCRMLHARIGSYEGVARRTGLDRRTVRKYIKDSPELKTE